MTVKERYVNEPRPRPNENNPKDRMTKKSLKENESYYLYQQSAPW